VTPAFDFQAMLWLYDPCMHLSTQPRPSEYHLSVPPGVWCRRPSCCWPGWQPRPCQNPSALKFYVVFDTRAAVSLAWLLRLLLLLVLLLPSHTRPLPYSWGPRPLLAPGVRQPHLDAGLPGHASLQAREAAGYLHLRHPQIPAGAPPLISGELHGTSGLVPGANPLHARHGSQLHGGLHHRPRRPSLWEYPAGSEDGRGGADRPGGGV
jgi:hypothetical protein